MKDNTRKDFAVATVTEIKNALLQFIAAGYYGKEVVDETPAMIKNSSDEDIQMVVEAVLVLTSNEGRATSLGVAYGSTCWCRVGENKAWQEKNDLADYLEFNRENMSYCGYLESVIINSLWFIKK